MQRRDPVRSALGGSALGQRLQNGLVAGPRLASPPRRSGTRHRQAPRPLGSAARRRAGRRGGRTRRRNSRGDGGRLRLGRQARPAPHSPRPRHPSRHYPLPAVRRQPRRETARPRRPRQSRRERPRRAGTPVLRPQAGRRRTSPRRQNHATVTAASASTTPAAMRSTASWSAALDDAGATRPPAPAKPAITGEPPVIVSRSASVTRAPGARRVRPRSGHPCRSPPRTASFAASTRYCTWFRRRRTPPSSSLLPGGPDDGHRGGLTVSVGKTAGHLPGSRCRCRGPVLGRRSGVKRQRTRRAPSVRPVIKAHSMTMLAFHRSHRASIAGNRPHHPSNVTGATPRAPRSPRRQRRAPRLSHRAGCGQTNVSARPNPIARPATTNARAHLRAATSQRRTA